MNEPFEAHLDDDAIHRYCEADLSGEQEAIVQEHLSFCDFCANRATDYADYIASITGFDPLSGERFHLDHEWVVEEIKPLREREREVMRMVAAVTEDQTEQFPKQADPNGRLEVSLKLTGRHLRAVVTDNLIPQVGVEVRLEHRAKDDHDRSFELFAWNVTDEHGEADLGPMRDFKEFQAGDRFVLGLVKPLRHDGQ